MNQDKQRIAIAEACGWKRTDAPPPIAGEMPFYWANGEDTADCDGEGLPDYLNDLNAMHEAEKVLTPEQVAVYDANLFTHGATMLTRYQWHATAAQRAEALLRTIGKWEEA